jgi:predicted transcriptional regulator YheO
MVPRVTAPQKFVAHVNILWIQHDAVSLSTSRKVQILTTPAPDIDGTNARRPKGAYVAELLVVLTTATDALAASIKGDTEIVVHDLRKPQSSIVRIVNGHITGRAVGNALFTGPSGADNVRNAQTNLGDPREIRVVSKYRAWAGDKPLSSTSTIYFDDHGVAAAILCLNTDTTLAERLQQDLASFIGAPAGAAPEALESRETTMGDLVAEIPQSAIAAIGVPVARMTKAEKVAAAQAARISIVRDDWGIAHVHGKSDADAVFGMVYAQAEDDFNRVETNYITPWAGWPRPRAKKRSGRTCA